MRFRQTLIIGILFIAGAAAAQEPQPESDLQSWNDISLTVPVSKKVDFNLTFTARFGKNITRINDGRVLVGFTWKPTASFSIQPSYTAIEARNSNSLFRTEHRLSLRGTYRFPTQTFGLSHRSIIERRLRRPVNSWRYRPSLTIEKDLPKSFIPGSKIYFTEEVFYDSLLERFSRNRATLGISKTLSKKLSIDLYYLRQNDGTTRPGDLHVIGTNLRIKP